MSDIKRILKSYAFADAAVLYICGFGSGVILTGLIRYTVYVFFLFCGLISDKNGCKLSLLGCDCVLICMDPVIYGSGLRIK